MGDVTTTFLTSTTTGSQAQAMCRMDTTWYFYPMPEQQFDPEKIIDGYTIRYGDVTLGGDCWMGMPAIYREGIDRWEVPEDHDRYPRTEEEYEQYGARLPDVVETKVMREIEIGCENYQALVAAGVNVVPCPGCPLLQE